MSTTQELQGLLDGAVQSLVICGPGSRSSEQCSLSSYRQALGEVRHRYAPDLRSVVSWYEVVIRDEIARENLLSFLRAALQDYIHDDRIQTAALVPCGGSGRGDEIGRVVKKLLQIAVSLGTARAASLFMRSLTEPECRFQDLTLLGGVTVDSPVGICDGVSLVLLPQDDAALPCFLPSSSYDVDRFRGGTVIVEDMLASPRYMNPQDHEIAGGTESFRVMHESAEAEDFQANEFCNALSLVAGASVFPSCRWSYLSDDEPAKLRRPMTGGIWMDESRPQYRKVVTGEQIQQAKQLHESLTTMKSSDRKRLTVPIDRLIASWDRRGRADSQIDKLIDLGIALESLYLPDDSGERTYRLRTRGARYMGADLAERQELAGLLKAFYGARSQAVHKGEVELTRFG